MRVIFFGMHGALSRLPLEALREAGLSLVAVAVAADPALQKEPLRELPPPGSLMLPLLGQQQRRGSVELAWELGIPALSIARLDAPETLAALGALGPDLICVSCFPRRLPPALLGLPPLGCLNLHPSALPRYRGPAPIFWQLRDGLDALGLSVHLMDAAFDRGPLLAQSSLALAEGMRGAEIDAALGRAGGALLAGAALDVARAAARAAPQGQGGSYQPWPRAEDFRIDPDWPAPRAFRFMRGTDDWQLPYRFERGEARLLLREALGYQAGRELGAPFVLRGDIVEIQLGPDVLRARRAALGAQGCDE